MATQKLGPFILFQFVFQTPKTIAKLQNFIGKTQGQSTRIKYYATVWPGTAWKAEKQKVTKPFEPPSSRGSKATDVIPPCWGLRFLRRILRTEKVPSTGGSRRSGFALPRDDGLFLFRGLNGRCSGEELQRRVLTRGPVHGPIGFEEDNR